VIPLAGPCLATHTACSSSLVAAHLAANGLANDECGAAVAAGVFMVLLGGTMAGICQLQVRGSLSAQLSFLQQLGMEPEFCPRLQGRVCKCPRTPAD